MDYFFIQFIIFLSVIAFIAILPLLIIFFTCRKKSRNKLKQILISFLSLLQLWIFYLIVTAFYPTDSFYFEEYKTVVGKPAPKSSIIIDKSASYPDVHGSYNSVSIIKLSDIEYYNLRKSTAQNKNFAKAEITYTETLQNVLDSNKYIDQVSWMENKNSTVDWEHCFIGFINDQKMIIIYYIKN